MYLAGKEHIKVPMGEFQGQMRFRAALEPDHADKVAVWEYARANRCTAFHAQLDFIDTLDRVSSALRDLPMEERRARFEADMRDLNGQLRQWNVRIPTLERAHRVARVLVDDSFILKTATRTPLFLVLEVVGESESDGPSSGQSRAMRSFSLDGYESSAVDRDEKDDEDEDDEEGEGEGEKESAGARRRRRRSRKKHGIESPLESSTGVSPRPCPCGILFCRGARLWSHH